MIPINVNGKSYQVEAPPDMTLLWVLRDHLKLMGTKYSCGIGECGACVVHVNGEAVRSCTLALEDVAGGEITTIEGLAENHPVKVAWIEEQVVQCGYCQPGIMMQVAALLSATPVPDPGQIIDDMDDVICRCGTYVRIKRGIKRAVALMRKEA